MVKKCLKCGETKDVKLFRYTRNKKEFCAYCRDCESLYAEEYRDRFRKQNLKKSIRANWLKLCELMDSVELDSELYNLKKIWEQVQDNAK